MFQCDVPFSIAPRRESLTPRNCQERHTRQHSTLFPGLQTELTRCHCALRAIRLLKKKDLPLCILVRRLVGPLKLYFSSVGSVGRSNPDELVEKQTSGTPNMDNRYFSDMFTAFVNDLSSPRGSVCLPYIGSTAGNWPSSISVIAGICSIPFFFFVLLLWETGWMNFRQRLLKAELQLGCGNVTLYLKVKGSQNWNGSKLRISRTYSLISSWKVLCELAPKRTEQYANVRWKIKKNCGAWNWLISAVCVSARAKLKSRAPISKTLQNIYFTQISGVLRLVWFPISWKTSESGEELSSKPDNQRNFANNRKKDRIAVIWLLSGSFGSNYTTFVPYFPSHTHSEKLISSR